MTVEVKAIPLSDIDVDVDWNSRSPGSILASASETDEESTGLDGLEANILRHGQDTPVDVRLVVEPFYKFTDKPYSLVAGFRRFSVVAKINGDDTLKATISGNLIPGLENGTIRAAVHPPMTEQDAFLLNARENTNRDQLTPPDVFRLVQKATVGFGMTPADAAVALGKSPSTIGNYSRMCAMPGKVLEHWCGGGDFDGVRSIKRIGISDMFDIARRKPEEHWDAYKRAIVLQTKKGDTSAWWEKAKGRANAMGGVLARLQRAGFLTVHAPMWTNVVDIIVRVGKRELKFVEARELATLAEGSFKRELEKPVSVSASTEEQERDDVDTLQ
jgi:hypothetical protein